MTDDSQAPTRRSKEIDYSNTTMPNAVELLAEDIEIPEDIIENFANKIERTVKSNEPARVAGFQRMGETGSVGFPVWLRNLMQEAGWDSHAVEAIELGGRGVLHPTIGWISVEELRELADDE